MPRSHDAPPETLDRALEVGPGDWQGPAFYQLMTALVIPRPIGWISTISAATARYRRAARGIASRPSVPSIFFHWGRCTLTNAPSSA